MIRTCLVIACLVAGCAEGDQATVDRKTDVDPALAMALEDQILIDPTLSQQANEDVIRPPDRPVLVLVPHAPETPPRP